MLHHSSSCEELISLLWFGEEESTIDVLSCGVRAKKQRKEKAEKCRRGKEAEQEVMGSNKEALVKSHNMLSPYALTKCSLKFEVISELFPCHLSLLLLLQQTKFLLLQLFVLHLTPHLQSQTPAMFPFLAVYNRSSSYLIQENIVQTLHQVGVLHVTTQEFRLLNKLLSPLLHDSAEKYIMGR